MGGETLCKGQEDRGQTGRDVAALTDDVSGGLEGQLYDGLVMVRSRLVENREDVLPTRADVGRLRVHHLGHTPDYHVPNGRGPASGSKIKVSLSEIILRRKEPQRKRSPAPVLLNNVLKRPQEIFLEAEVGQLAFLQELHGQLPQ